ncbi:MAG: hypothetical protein ACRCS8_04860 [Brevinema sp.]
MSIFDAEKTERMTTILSAMVNPVKILLFVGDNEKSKETRQFVLEFLNFSPKLSLEIYNQTEADNTFQASPLMILTDEHKSNKGVRFLGTPGGFEINSFLMAILDLSGQGEALSIGEKVVLDRIRKPLDIFAYVSLNCAKCPRSVMFIHRLAAQSNLINAYMIEADAFKAMADKDRIKGYPTIKIGNQLLIGDNALDMEKIIQAIKDSL